MGDFNECMWDFEQFSLSPRPLSYMQAFRDALEICELAGLGFSGVPHCHTYGNRRSGAVNVKVHHSLITDLFELVVTPEINEGLCAEFSHREIGDTMFQIGHLKAPAPYGFLHVFSSAIGTL